MSQSFTHSTCDEHMMSGKGCSVTRSDRFTDFRDTDSDEQVLANFANFASNPRNLEDLRTLQVTELFLDIRREETVPCMRNLASVFLQDCCTEEQVVRAEAPMQGHNPTALGSPFLRTRLAKPSPHPG
uniref:Uncharacterized protein n=1 Tax=Salmo trutta TaxID=8032 RepID=A0A673XZ77_SALTR